MFGIRFIIIGKDNLVAAALRAGSALGQLICEPAVSRPAEGGARQVQGRD